jgi:RNA polymerase sigma factor (sigma-70 family)
MDDREIVAAIAAGAPDGLSGAYDKYAESIYGYCRWMLLEPDDAAEAVRETFALAGELGKLRDPGKVRSWLFTTARIECLRRPGAAQPVSGEGFDEGLEQGLEQGLAGASSRADTERAELRRLIGVTLAELPSDEREAVELSLWHDLDDTDLAAVLGVSRPRAYALASNGRRRLENALGALRVARTRRGTCPELGTLLADWDGRLTIPALTVVDEHIEQCEACAQSGNGTLRPAALRRLLPRPALPPGLRARVLELGATGEPPADRPRVTPGKFPQAAALLAGWAGRVRLAGWDRIRRHPKVAATAAVLLVAAAISGPLMAASSAHTVRDLGAQSGPAATDPGSAAAASGAAPVRPAAGRSPSPQHGSPAPANFLQPSAGAPSTVTPSRSARPKPSGSPQATGSASSSPSSSSAPVAGPTPSHTTSSPPASPSASATPSPDPSPTDTTDPTPTPTADPTST